MGARAVQQGAEADKVRDDACVCGPSSLAPVFVFAGHEKDRR